MDRLENSIKLFQGRCPYCNEEMTGTTEVTGNRVKPSPTDLAICLYCLGVSEYDVMLKLKPVDVSTLSVELRAQLDQAKQRIINGISIENAKRFT